MTQNLLILLITSLFFSQVYSDSLCASQSYQTVNVASLPYSGTISQTECVYFFAVQPGVAPLNNYLIIEVQISNSIYRPQFMPLVMADIVYPSATLDDGTIKPKSRWVDTNGFNNMKLYQYIIIAPTNINAIDTYYFAVYKGYTEEPFGNTYDYTVTIRTSSSFECPKNCDGHGTCDVSAQQCQCDEGYFDQDCSVEATKLVAGSFSSMTIDQSVWNYFYFNIEDISNDLKLLFEKDVGVVDISFMVNTNDNFTVPNSIQTVGKYELPSKQTQSHLMVEKKTLAKIDNDIALIGVFSTDSSSMTIQASFESYDSTSVIRIVSLAVFGTITGLIFASWILFSLLRVRSHQDMEALIQQHEGEKEEEKILSRKDFFKYFPKKKFQELHSPFPQTSCSICIDDFTPESMCRQLYCDHIFHENCIGAWLNQHHDCPNCKKEMTKVAIEEFLKHKSEDLEKPKQIHPYPARHIIKTDVHEQARHSIIKTDVREQARHSIKLDTYDQASQDGSATRKTALVSPLRIDIKRPPRESLLKVAFGREEIRHDDDPIIVRRKTEGVKAAAHDDVYSQESNSPDELKKIRQRIDSGNISPRIVPSLPRGSLIQSDLQDRVQSRLRRHSRQGFTLPMHAEVEKSSFKPQTTLKEKVYY